MARHPVITHMRRLKRRRKKPSPSLKAGSTIDIHQQTCDLST
jgi:hypothetical protein